MTVTYDLKVDTSNNGSYAYNAGPDLLRFNLDRGRNDRIGIASIGQLTATLFCPDKRYHLNSASRVAGLAKGRRILLQAICAGERLPLFAGRLHDIVPVLGPHGEPWRAEMIVQDASVFLGENEVSVPAQKPLPYSTLINAVLDSAGWSGPRDIYTQGEFAAFGAVVDKTPYQVLEDVIAGEGGIFFVDRSGKAVYWGHRYRDSFRRSSQLDISDMAQDYSQEAPDVVTEVYVTAQPYTEFGPDDKWSHPSLPFQLKAKPVNSKTFIAGLSEPVTRLAPMAQDTDYQAKIDDNQASSKQNGNRRDGWLHPSVQLLDTSTARVTVYNDGGHKNFTVKVTRFRLRGYTFRAGDLMEVKAP